MMIGMRMDEFSNHISCWGGELLNIYSKPFSVDPQMKRSFQPCWFSNSHIVGKESGKLGYPHRKLTWQ